MQYRGLRLCQSVSAQSRHHGRAVPGHAVAIVDEHGVPVAAGVTGNIAIKSPDPVMFLGYWNNPAASADKFAGGYLLTGDLGQCDDEGYFRYVGRDDDVITSAGYRIGPGPIEECLLKHPAVKIAAVIGKKDAHRTEIVKAFIVLNEGFADSAELVAAIQEHVRTHLAAHEYPREIAFLDALPSTPTGKIMRRTLRDAEMQALTQYPTNRQHVTRAAFNPRDAVLGNIRTEQLDAGTRKYRGGTDKLAAAR